MVAASLARVDGSNSLEDTVKLLQLLAANLDGACEVATEKLHEEQNDHERFDEEEGAPPLPVTCNGAERKTCQHCTD